MGNDYDKIIEEFCDEWENKFEDSQDVKKQTLMLSLTRHILPIIYSKIRQRNLHERISVNYPKSFVNTVRVKFIVKRIYWGALWTIKWLINRKNIYKKNVILTAVGSDRKLTKLYLENLAAYSESCNSIVISLNIPCFVSFLKRSNIYYYNRFIKDNFNQESDEKLFENIYELLDELSIKHFGFILDSKKYLKTIFRSYYRDYLASENLVKELNPSQIKLLLVDFDYTTNKVIYTKICREYKIPTICIDHSVQIYNHIFKRNYCDLKLVWGEHSKQRTLSENNRVTPVIKIVSRPGKVNFIKQSKKGTNWLYILSSYVNPAYQTINRSLDLTIEYLVGINEIIKKREKNKILLKSHPEDGKIIFRKIKSLLKNKTTHFNGNLFDSLNKFELIFIEDTTLLIDLALSNIPIVYLSDRNKNDIFNLSQNKSFGFVDSKEKLESEIELQLNNKIDKSERVNFFDRFVNTDLKFETEFVNSIHNFIEKG